MAKKFTPGPWLVVPEDHVNGNFSIETPEYWPHYVAQTVGGSLVDEKANAHLIAAAPELLEALELMLPNIEALAAERWGKAFLDTYKPILKAKVAINKSYGKEVQNG